MGNRPPQVDVAPSEEEARQAVTHLMGIQHELTFPEIMPLIKKILAKVKVDWPLRQKNMSKPLVKVFTHPFYQDITLRMFRLLRQELQYILNKKTLIMVSRDDWKRSQLLVQFLTIFTNERLVKLINTLPQKIKNEEILESVGLQLGDEEPAVPNIFDSFGIEDKRETIKLFRDTLYYSLKLKENVIGRSPVSYYIIYIMAQPLFSMYLRMMLEIQVTDTETMSEYFSGDNFKKNVIICTYLIGYSLEYEVTSILDMSVLMLSRLFELQDTTEIAIPAIPSFVFDKIPLMVCSTIYEQISTLLLFGLTEFVKNEQGDQKVFIQRHHFSRIKSLRLLKLVISDFKPKNKQTVYYLQLLCRTVGLKKIEKYCLYTVADSFVKGTNIKTNGIIKYIQKYQTKPPEMLELEPEQNSKSNASNFFQNVDPYEIDKELGKVLSNQKEDYQALSEKFIYENLCNAGKSEDFTELYLLPFIDPILQGKKSSRQSAAQLGQMQEEDEENEKYERPEKVESSDKYDGLQESPDLRIEDME